MDQKFASLMRGIRYSIHSDRTITVYGFDGFSQMTKDAVVSVLKTYGLKMTSYRPDTVVVAKPEVETKVEPVVEVVKNEPVAEAVAEPVVEAQVAEETPVKEETPVAEPVAEPAKEEQPVTEDEQEAETEEEHRSKGKKGKKYSKK